MIELHCPVASSQLTFRGPRPWVRVAEDGSVFLYTGINSGDKADIIVRNRVGRAIEHNSVRCV